jgi:hypothetical protein
MDLFTKSIQTIDYHNPLLKILPSHINSEEYFLKLAIYGENERVILLEVKDFHGLPEQYYSNFLKNIPQANKNYLKFKFVVENKEQERSFFCYEDADITLKEYLDSTNTDFETRLYFFKRVLDVIFDLKVNNSSFDFYDPNLLFVQNNTSKRPCLKTIYHGNLIKLI